MSQIFIIAAEYGKWDDCRQDDLFATLDEQQAHDKLVELAGQFADVFAQMVENYAHIGSFGELSGDKNVIKTAIQAHYVDGLTLVLRAMEVGCTTNGCSYLERCYVLFMPKDYVSLNDVEPSIFDSKYERMAFPYEQEFFGVKH